MKVLIVEDETAAYESLVQLLAAVGPQLDVLGNTESVSQTIHWLNNHPQPDLIFMDIHLSDGSAFLIFDHMEVQVPIIFTTAYDEYALEAFKVNSIDYLLKPIKEVDLKRALDKFTLRSQADLTAYIAQLSQLSQISARTRYPDRLLIPVKDQLMPIALEDVSYFYTSDKNTSIGLRDGRSLAYSRSLEQIYNSLNPQDFYRANKQFIIARNAVENITIWFDSRLLIKLNSELPERIYISKNKAADFKEWFTKI